MHPLRIPFDTHLSAGELAALPFGRLQAAVGEEGAHSLTMIARCAMSRGGGRGSMIVEAATSRGGALPVERCLRGAACRFGHAC